MKVTCQSCQAKYTIADEKVRGKVAKIRCKKCGTTIIVDGNDPATSSAAKPPGSGPVADYTHQGANDEPWTVLVADGDQRTLTAAQVAELYASGTVGFETLVWRDGMADWTAITQVDALRSVIENGPRPTMTPLEAAASMPSSAPPPAPAAEAPGSRQPAAMAARARAVEPAAARRPGRGGSTDLFGAAAHEDVLTSASESGAPHHGADGSDKLTGARNENSVLFSLSALTGPSTSSAPERDPTSNKADLRALMGSGGGAPAKSKIDDIMNLSGGGVYSPGLLASPALAPPPIDLMTAAAAPAGSGGSKSKSLMVAIGGGVLVIGAVAIAFTTMSSKADSTDKSGAAASAAPGANALAARGASNAANEGTGEPAAAAGEPMRQGETARQPEAPATEPAAVAVAPGSPAPKPEGEKPEKVERKTAAAPRAEKPAAAPPAGLPPPVAAPAPAPAPAPAAPAAPAAGGSGDFDRAAALSALSAAATAAQACRKPDGPTGSGRVAVTFANNGTATTANVEGPPFAGTPVGGCVAARFRSVHIPPFGGSVITVRKTFIIQ